MKIKKFCKVTLALAVAVSTMASVVYVQYEHLPQMVYFQYEGHVDEALKLYHLHYVQLPRSKHYNLPIVH